MLSLANPEALLLLAAAPLTAWFQWRMPRPVLVLPSAAPFRNASCIDCDRWRDALGRSLIVAFLALALAGPRIPDLKTRLPSEGIAIAMVVDVSGSMATPDFSNESRLDAAKSAFARFINHRGRDAIALVTFAATPRTECPPSLNATVVKNLLNKLEPRTGVDAGTNIGDAIAEALLRLQSSAAKRKVIILLSDGEHNATSDGADAPLTPRQAAQLAANLKVPLYAIDCGGEPDAADEEAVKQRAMGRAIMNSSAELTGGKTFTANSTEELEETLQAIDRLERGAIESYQYRRYFDFRWYCGIAAMVIWILLAMIEATFGRTLP